MLAKTFQPGSQFCEKITVLSPRSGLTRNSVPFWNFRVSVAGELFSVRAFIGKSYQGPTTIEDGLLAHLTARWQQWQNEHYLLAKIIAPIRQQAQDSTLSLLRALYLMIQHPGLKRLLHDLGKDEFIFTQWQQCPASGYHHHAYPGGLLEHSVEAAWIVMRSPELPIEKREVAAVAALLHDIGKIRCFDALGNRSLIGKEIRHEALSLEILSPFLAQLDRVDMAVATDLRRQLWRQNHPSRLDRMDELLVQQADQLSTMLSMH